MAMSKFEKIILPLLDCGLTSKNLTESSGFIDCFTGDLDKPSGEKEFFIVYNDSIRTKESIESARILWKSMSTIRSYVKIVDGIPYYIYSIWVKPNIKKLYKKGICLTAEQKAKILRFWGSSDSVVKYVLDNQIVSVDIEHNIPPMDYYESEMYLEVPK